MPDITFRRLFFIETVPECFQLRVTVQICVLKIFHNDRLFGLQDNDAFHASTEILNQVVVHRNKPTLKVINEVGKEELFRVIIDQVRPISR